MHELFELVYTQFISIIIKLTAFIYPQEHLYKHTQYNANES